MTSLRITIVEVTARMLDGEIVDELDVPAL